MSKITTDDCKNFLSNSFPDQTKWKRLKKYKNEQGEWYRDFESETGFFTTLVERDGVLGLVLQEKKEFDCFYYKKFPDSKVKLAKKIVSDYINGYTCQSDEYAEIESNMPGYKAIPNCFEFFIDCDLEDANENTLVTKTSYKDFTFSVFFRPINYDFDQHLQELLSGLIPKYMNEEMECVFEVSPKESMTAKEIVQMLCDRGFVYNSKECAFNRSFKNHKVLPKQ